ncbi:MAG: hypothetical protein HZA08_06400 [Nitrospirae bacterium]|nr:hypothetical protein [Nitrospirota bacterium]
METIKDNSNTDLRVRAINLNRTFAGMLPIIRRTRLISLNAEIASAHIGEQGAPFSVVVKDLLVMSHELSKLIEEIEKIFFEMANHIAKWGVAEMKLDLLKRSLNNVLSQKNEPIFYEWESSVNSAALRKWENEKSRCTKNSIEYHLWSETINCGREILKNLSTMEGRSKKLCRIIDNIRMVAVRQCHFISITALVESARVNNVQSDLPTVASNIRALSKDIADFEDMAHDQVLAITGMLTRTVNFI